MTDGARVIAELWLSALWPFGVVLLRTGAAMALLPGFGHHAVPARVRLTLALAFAVVVTPAVADRLPAGDRAAPLLLVTEPLAGLALGFVLRLVVMAIEMAGSWAAQAGSLSQMFGGTGEPMPALAHLLTMAALALLMIEGGHVRFASGLILSYEAMPAGMMPPAALIRAWTTGHVDMAFTAAFSLSAPFAIAALLYNVALGIINRAMPSLMVSFIGAPALAGGMLVLMAILVPLLVAAWWPAAAALLADPFRVPR